MFYTIYETTNNITGKKYIGKHVTEDVNDSYLGSGKILKLAIKKHGIDNFTKTVLVVCDSEEDMNNKEREIVNIDVVNNPEYYNSAIGGNGGCIVLKKGHPLYNEVIEKIRLTNQSRSKEQSKRAKELHQQKKLGMYGKSQSEFQKQTVSKLNKGIPKKKEHVIKQRESILRTVTAEGYVHPNTGKKKSKESLEKRQKTLSKIPPQTCPHCNKTLDFRNYARYHGEMCREKS